MRNTVREYLHHHRLEAPMLAGVPSSETQLRSLGDALGVEVPPQLAAFLMEFGAMFVGSQPIFGVEPAEEMGLDGTIERQTRRFRRETAWQLPLDALVVSDDGRGNPFFVCNDGKVRYIDHDFSSFPEPEVVADSFDEFVESILVTEGYLGAGIDGNDR